MTAYAPTVDNHVLLTDRANMLDPDEIQAHAQVAMSLLQVIGFSPSAQSDRDLLDTAIVLQINFQVEAGVEGYLMQEARRGGRNIVYRGKNRLQHVHRQALEMVREMKTRLGAW